MLCGVGDTPVARDGFGALYGCRVYLRAARIISLTDLIKTIANLRPYLA